MGWGTSTGIPGRLGRPGTTPMPPGIKEETWAGNWGNWGIDKLDKLDIWGKIKGVGVRMRFSGVCLILRAASISSLVCTAMCSS